MKSYFSFVLILLSSLTGFAQSGKTEKFRLILKDNWQMQSEVKDGTDAARLSTPEYKPVGWFHVSIPTTIIGGLLANKEYDFDPFYGNNLERIKGERFDHPWWFRKTFTLPASEKNKTVTVKLHGINYKANVWLNGHKIADSTQIKGPFRIIELDLTKYIHYSGPNTLALEVMRPFNPQRGGGDLAIDYADWIHYPPDYNGGIVNDIEIRTFDQVSIDYPFVNTHFDLPSLDKAHLDVYAIVKNYSDREQDVLLKGTINRQVSFQKKVHLQAGEERQVDFSSTEFPQLTIKNPRIWWPWQYGKQELNRIELTLLHNNKISQEIGDYFGIRQVSSRLIDTASREFYINGKPIMLRGAAWAPDIFQRRSENRQEQEVKLVRDMNMNIIRSEGKLEDDHFYSLCDKYGLLVMSGWMCCGAWQYPELWDASKRNVAMGSDSSVMLWLRNKPCMLVWLNGSDMPPRDTTVEREWLTIEDQLKWPNPLISTADRSKSRVSGYSGVKMNGPYEWVPPIYWETDSSKHGGAWSFATEISPGPSIPPYESLLRFISPDSLWYTNSHWLYHTGTGMFGSTHVFDSALNERYGPSKTIAEYAAKAQVQNYEAHRAMMEAYGLYKYHTATGVVQWMLSNPWPGLIWHTYDYYLNPTGTYYGIKKGLEPLHVMYSYKSNNVFIINSFLKKYTGLRVAADIYDTEGKLIYQHASATLVSEDSIADCFAIPDLQTNGTVFLRLKLYENNAVKDINWYWLSGKKDELNWSASKWYYTPQSSFADFSDLQHLRPVGLAVSYTSEKKNDSTALKINVTNKGNTVAFFVHMRLMNGNKGGNIAPVLFSDDYILLAPGESRSISCTYANKDAQTPKPYLNVSSWNIDLNKSTMNGHGGFGKELQR